jgi:hypothetical protein
MDADTQLLLVRLLRTQRVGALGTLRDNSPYVSLIGFSPSQDLSAMYILASRLAYHTQDILKEPRCSLMVAETDRGDREPQTLARVTLRGEATPVHPEAPEYDEARSLFLKKFPEAAFLFELGDFSLYRIPSSTGRFVAGFGKTFNISVEDLKRISTLSK